MSDPDEIFRHQPEWYPRRSSQRLRFRATRDSEARLLLLIDTFSRNGRKARYLEGRVKLAKLDFLLRYPHHLKTILEAHGASAEEVNGIDEDEGPLDSRMMRYRYGPWDPAYYAILGSLIGRGLVEVLPLPGSTGFGYHTSELGARVAADLLSDESFARISERLALLKKYLDKSGSTLKSYLYELPEVADATWHEDVR
jgi:hypothetical protein